MECQKMPVPKVAKLLGMAECEVRYQIKTGQLPIGECVKKPGNKNGRYYVYKRRLANYLGYTDIPKEWDE